jgi:hypothetical protein
LSQQQSREIYVNRVDLFLLGDEDRFVYALVVPINDELRAKHLWVLIRLYSEHVLVIELVNQIRAI